MISGRTARIISGLLALAAAAVLLIANGGDDNSGGGTTTLGLPTVSTPQIPTTETSGLPPADTTTAPTGPNTPQTGGAEIPADQRAAIGEVLKLIDAGGPFPNEQDGTVFSNREGLLPSQPSGYYHEYTVPTPGSPDRGARRLVTGQGGEVHYTSDHYRSFTQIDPSEFK